jgi:WD40 repeat protein
LGTGQELGLDDEVNDAVFNRDETRILTWSDDKTARLWEAGTGKPIGPPMRHDDDINGAVFNRDETRILTWSGHYTTSTARLWDIGVDYDFPVDLLKLQIAALTGTEFDAATGEITCIEPERWEKMKAQYLEKASQHYKSCQYKNANIFHRFYPDVKIGE